LQTADAIRTRAQDLDVLLSYLFKLSQLPNPRTFADAPGERGRMMITIRVVNAVGYQEPTTTRQLSWLCLNTAVHHCVLLWCAGEQYKSSLPPLFWEEKSLAEAAVGGWDTHALLALTTLLSQPDKVDSRLGRQAGRQKQLRLGR
jgi:hypothetical protein